MNEQRLAQALAPLISPVLSQALAARFVSLRRDLATRTLERATPGKFVETFVQSMQHLANGSYDTSPNVDAYLSQKLENEIAIPEGLRVCGGRIARSIYTLRNKRNIAHNNPIDANRYDLAFIHQGAAWIMAELIRNAIGISMHEAGALVELIEAPVGTLVEEIDGVRLVHAEVSVRAELLILLHSQYPDYVSFPSISKSLKSRSAASVRNRINELKGQKVLHGDTKVGYRLTQAGYDAAVTEIQQIIRH